MLAVTGAFLIGCTSSSHSADIPEELEVIREGYLANRAAFTRGKCRFTYSIWYADSEADALAGKPRGTEPPLSRESTLFMDGDAFTIKVELDGRRIVEEMRANRGIIVPTTIAKKGEYAIDHDALINTAVVHSPSNRRLKVPYHPFNLAVDADVGSPASFITYAAGRGFEGVEFEVEQNAVRDVIPYIKLSINASYNSHNKVMWIDPKRGYMNYITESFRRRTGEFTSRMYLREVHEENGAFFPMHAIDISPLRATDGTSLVQVREMRVEELNLSYHPTREDMTIYLPKHTQYSDGVNPNTAKSLFRDGDAEFAPIHVDEIEGIYHQLQALAKERAEEEAAAMAVRTPPSPRPRGSVLYWLAGVNLAALALILAVYWQRRRSRQTAG